MLADGMHGRDDCNREQGGTDEDVSENMCRRATDGHLDKSMGAARDRLCWDCVQMMSMMARNGGQLRALCGDK